MSQFYKNAEKKKCLSDWHTDDKVDDSLRYYESHPHGDSVEYSIHSLQTTHTMGPEKIFLKCLNFVWKIWGGKSINLLKI